MIIVSLNKQPLSIEMISGMEMRSDLVLVARRMQGNGCVSRVWLSLLAPRTRLRQNVEILKTTRPGNWVGSGTSHYPLKWNDKVLSRGANGT